MSRTVPTGKCKNTDCNNQVPEGLVCRDCHDAMCAKWYNEQVENMSVKNVDGGSHA